jgi:hypothetical protein
MPKDLLGWNRYQNILFERKALWAGHFWT